VNEPFNLVNATTNFPRPKSEPNMSAAAPPAPAMRQPRADPMMLGDSSVVEGQTSVVAGQSSVVEGQPLTLDARRQPRASNASLSSLSVSRRLCTASSVSSQPPAAPAGLSALPYCLSM